MINHIVKAAKIQANASTERHKMGAVIFSKKSIISVGRNCQLRSAKSLLSIFQKRENSIHAEVAAILRARVDLTGCHMLVVRVNNQGKLRMAKPCAHCIKYLEYVGIKDVFYSNRAEQIERLKL